MRRDLGGTLRRHQGGNAGAFRRSSLLLFLIPLPLLALWLWEGKSGLGGHPDSRSIIAAHRIAGWLIPVTCGMVFGYGIARTEPDVRLAAMGLRDPRYIWARRWLPIAGMFLLGVGVAAILLSFWSAESVPRLLGASLSTTLFALATGYVVSVLTGAAPGAVAFTVAIIVIGGAMAPQLAGLPAAASLSPGPLGWIRAVSYRWEFLLHDVLVTGLAIGAIIGAMLVPQDIRSLRWITGYQPDDA